jgi:N,N'-diacetyllegionaminate synthase
MDGRFAGALRAGRCYVIAEAGSNHNGDWESAIRLIDVAAEAGADAVKFQLFHAERLYPRDAGRADYLGVEEDIYDIVARMELPESWLPGLAARCAEAGVDFLASAFDEVSVDTLDPFVPIHKVASYELTHEPLLNRVGQKGKPVLLSTGGAQLDEIGPAIDTLKSTGATEVVVLQCTAAYPARLEAVNVAALAGLRERFGVPTGLSDHSSDPAIAPVLAVAFGAVVVEKHFTLDRTLPGPDHRFALDPAGLARMVEAVRGAELARGSAEKDVHPDEEELRSFARRSVFATRDIEPGAVLDERSIAVLRAGKAGAGLPPSAYASLLGRRAARAVAANRPLVADDVA